MDTTQLAEEIIGTCLGSSGGAVTERDGREATLKIEDGRAMLIASNPRSTSAAVAVQLKLNAVARDDGDGRDMQLLESTWDNRLSNGFVAVREDDGTDMVALVAHRATATVPLLADDLATLFAVAQDPGAAAEAAPPMLEQTDNMVWMRV